MKKHSVWAREPGVQVLVEEVDGGVRISIGDIELGAAFVTKESATVEWYRWKRIVEAMSEVKSEA